MADKKMSPMMVHYLETKKQYPDCILFYRLGDFYEMFFEDAQTAASELELVLTGKDCGMDERAPMCGIPYHAAETYITRLVKKGYKVAIAEQTEDPKTAKGLVRREVIRVVTPGTIISSDALDDGRNNYLMCVAYVCGVFGLSAIDIGTGEFYLSETSDLKSLMDFYTHFSPSEIICNDEFFMSGADTDALSDREHGKLNPMPRDYFSEDECRKLLEKHFHADISGLGISDMPSGMIAAGAVLRYVYDTQFSTVSYVTGIRIYNLSEHMILDSSTMRNLELLETLREKEKKGSLLYVLDKTRTAMGARLMRKFISEPLIQKQAIMNRQDAVEELCGRFIDREEMMEYMRPVYDIDRLLSRISSISANPRDLLMFRQSLSMIPYIKEVLRLFSSPLLKKTYEGMDELSDIYELLMSSIDEDAPASQKDGGIIKEGYDSEADRLRYSKNHGKELLLRMEQEEREKTGIRTLKIKFNKVFGYSIEISNSFKDQVPERYRRRQTLANGERYTTDELEKLEEELIGADEKLKALEYELFLDIKERVASEARRIHSLSASLAMLDVLCSLSLVAQRNNFVRPSINEEGVISIRDGRHPVVELMLGDGSFIPNDTFLDEKDHRVNIITGPNMAGKSTYMRQVALIVLMAQIGSFIPARKADISICDRIFTRVGASDDLASGQSTFMVEMTEVANILRNATKKSLLILDEIGRGTSTFDGLSIAWAVTEYVSNMEKLGAKTLFATHYHELTELEGKLPGVHNYCIAVKENEDGLVFLRKIVPGGADKSYGVAVARLAGVPEEVTERADEISEELSRADITKAAKKLNGSEGRKDQGSTKGIRVSMTKEEFRLQKDIADEIRKTDTSKLTPIEALLLLDEMKKKLLGGEKD